MVSATKKNWFKPNPKIEKLLEDLNRYPVQVNVDPITRQSLGRIKALKPLKKKDLFINESHVAKTNRVVFLKEKNGYIWKKLF